MAAQMWLYGGKAALDLIGGHFQSQAIKEAAKLNNDIAEMNAQFAELDAYDEKLRGLGESSRYQKVVDQTLAEQQTNLAAADVDVNFGTASTIQKETRFIAEMNKMEIEKRAEERALGYKSQARQFRFQGDLNQIQSEVRASNARFNAVNSAINNSITGYQRSR